MAYLTDYQYYENGGLNPENENWGSYQYISLNDIVNNFMVMYVGNDKLINNVERYNIIFHAKRAIQELNYDSLKEIKILELNVCDSLRFILPPDYVNWVRISMYRGGTLLPLTENIQTNWSSAYLQDNNCKILFDENGNILKPENSTIDNDRITGSKKSIYLNEQSNYNGQEGYFYNGIWYFEYPIGGRFGLNTETANANPTFKINKKSGVINFSSSMADELVVIEYVSDGMEGGDDAEVSVNKLFEEFIYSYMKFVILQSKYGIQEYIINRARKEKSALLRNAKLRLSNIHPGRLLMNLRGQNKWIK
jgi:hypothetical protein|tara:strand:- start:2888 stop:3811 length:924 start_codon:yes stop_codon:yes gene_type:complete